MDNVYIVARNTKKTIKPETLYICAFNSYSVAQKKCDEINTYEQNIINPTLSLSKEKRAFFNSLEAAFFWATDEYYDSSIDYDKKERDLYINNGFDETFVDQYFKWKEINDKGLAPAFIITVPYSQKISD